ncbi:NAD(P)H-hydrate dehydratase [Namhaeicola litoreus]|uniref:Bifunctional NAD(P)H-hydrate repair enzyme n=1 Tax=Namhaeicola litoreus TaxID=1052145 RepID=A0ABW3Y5F5_9FLAO
MKIFNTSQIQKWDAYTIKAEQITSLDLMERAATACFDWLTEHVTFHNRRICFFCGVGNNGGDGLVMARKCLEKGYAVSVYIVHFSSSQSEDFKKNLQRLIDLKATINHLVEDNSSFNLKESDLIIDAIFGTGMSRDISGFTSEIIQLINQTGKEVIAIDMPSGLSTSSLLKNDGMVIKASTTLTFQCPKLNLLLPDYFKYYGEVVLINIGLSESFSSVEPSSMFYVDANFIKSFFIKRKKFDHKGTFGHSLLIGGSFGKIGAIVLATKAAIGAGSGLTTAFIPKCGYDILQTSVPEAMVEIDNDLELAYFNYKVNPTVIGLGMGMGTSEKTIEGFYRFLKHNSTPLVIDADAINILSKKPSFLELLPPETILTPHPKELERLIGKWSNDYEKIDLMTDFTEKHNCILVNKGANTLVVYKKEKYFNSTGNPGLAKGGSGDVLTGMITGLLAQKYTALQASILGIYLHGKAADCALEKGISEESLTASDVIQHIDNAFAFFSSKTIKK